MYKQHSMVYPEYLEANSHDEIVKAVRENLLFGAKTIKICVDCKAWGYSVEDIKLFIAEAAKGGAKVDGHVQTMEGGQRAIDAGIHVISHGQRQPKPRDGQEDHYLIPTAITPYRGTNEGKQAAKQLAREKCPIRSRRHGLLERTDEESGRHLDGPVTDLLPLTWKAGNPPKDT